MWVNDTQTKQHFVDLSTEPSHKGLMNTEYASCKSAQSVVWVGAISVYVGTIFVFPYCPPVRKYLLLAFIQ